MRQDYRSAYIPVNRFPCLPNYRESYTVAVMSYGERLRKARQHAGISQAQLAELVGMSQPGRLGQTRAGKRLIVEAPAALNPFQKSPVIRLDDWLPGRSTRKYRSPY